MRIGHARRLQLWANLALFCAPMVLSVENIFVLGLKSDVLPPDTVTAAAIVAAFEGRRDMLAKRIAVSQPETQPSKLAAQPHLLTVDICKPPTTAVMRPQIIITVADPAVQSPLPTHFQALIEGHGLQLPEDRGHVDGCTTLIGLHALGHQIGIPALVFGCPSGRAAVSIGCGHLAALERSVEALGGDGGTFS